jgi:hypothetical protein
MEMKGKVGRFEGQKKRTGMKSVPESIFKQIKPIYHRWEINGGKFFFFFKFCENGFASRLGDYLD